MNHAPASLERLPLCRLAAALLLGALPGLVHALPEDANQPIHTESASTELYLDEGLTIYRGTAEVPARITQGTMQISGTEIRIEMTPDNTLKKVTATGTPARFQQQPAADQELIHASGQTLAFDNLEQLVTADGQAEFVQAGYRINGPHIDYNVRTRQAKGDQGVQMVVPVGTGAATP